MTVVKAANMLLMFVLELGVLGAVGYWGFTLAAALPVRVLAGLGAIALFIAVWALFGARADATFPAQGLWRALLELGWFGGGAGALALAGRPTLAVVFGAVFILNAALRLYWKQV